MARRERIASILCGHDVTSVFSPAPYRYSIEHGAVFGLSHSLQQLALFRPGAKTGVDGFYLVGASSRPGNGVPLVMIGADQCAARVLQDIGGHCP
jgi:phytoene desaturase (3,4-didehydrolycopene-forming)